MKAQASRFIFEAALVCLIGALVFQSCGGGYTPGGVGAPSFTDQLEQEVVTNIRAIQVALERYATDHDGEYPRYIWGGDRQNWDAYYDTDGPDNHPRDFENGTQTAIYDPLIRYGYLDTYPKNPFAKDGASVIYQTTAFNGYFGQGDPRFGWFGDVMGNCLSDPRFPECDDTLGGADEGIWSGGNSSTIYQRPGLTWRMGGWWNEGLERSVVETWPGNFFYRSGGDIALWEDGTLPWTAGVAEGLYRTSGATKGYALNIVNLQSVDRFILGGYGSKDSSGFDVMRLALLDEDEGGLGWFGAGDDTPILHYQIPGEAGEQNEDYPLMFQEVFGGGTATVPPHWPYQDPETGDWLYGSPDGSPDGVVVYVTDRGDEHIWSKEAAR